MSNNNPIIIHEQLTGYLFYRDDSGVTEGTRELKIYETKYVSSMSPLIFITSSLIENVHIMSKAKFNDPKYHLVESMTCLPNYLLYKFEFLYSLHKEEIKSLIKIKDFDDIIANNAYVLTTYDHVCKIFWCLMINKKCFKEEVIEAVEG